MKMTTSTVNIIEQARHWANRKPDKLAIVSGDLRITYEHLYLLVLSTRSYLEAAIDGPRDGYVVVSIASPVDAWVAILAARSLGYATIVAKRTENVVFNRVQPIRAIVVTESEGRQQEIVERHGELGPVISLGPELYSESTLRRLSASGLRLPSKIGGHVCYTSGSSGAPKMVLQSAVFEAEFAPRRHKAFRILGNARLHNGGASFTGTSGWLNHAMAMYAGCTIFHHQGGPWLVDALLRNEISHIFINSRKVDEIIGFATKYTVPKRDALMIRVSGGFTSFSKIMWLKTNLTDNVHVGMGTTEAGAVLSRKVLTEEDVIWLEPFPGMTLDVVDEQGAALPPGQEGELRVRRAKIAPDRYLFDDALTAERFREGYFYTGDLAVQRPDGRIRLLGRISETISYPGGKLPTGPVEAEIGEHLSRSNVFVFSHQNDRFEDEVVVCLEGAEPVRDADVQWLREKFGSLSSLVVRTVDRFPSLPNGKTDRMGLRKSLLCAQAPVD